MSDYFDLTIIIVLLRATAIAIVLAAALGSTIVDVLRATLLSTQSGLLAGVNCREVRKWSMLPVIGVAFLVIGLIIRYERVYCKRCGGCRFEALWKGRGENTRTLAWCGRHSRSVAEVEVLLKSAGAFGAGPYRRLCLIAVIIVVGVVLGVVGY